MYLKKQSEYKKKYPNQKVTPPTKEAVKRYNEFKAIFKATGLTPEKVIKDSQNGDEIMIVLLNKDRGIENSNDKGLIRNTNSFIHEIDAHVEERINKTNQTSQGHHLKYYIGSDPVANQKIKGIVTGATTSDGKEKSPLPKDYVKGSEAKINYDEIIRTVKNGCGN